MKKFLLLAFLLCYTLMFVPVTGLAEGSHDHDHLEIQTADIEFVHDHDSHQDSVDPQQIPCPYWYDESHRFQRGNSWVEEKYSHTHNHYDPNSGITFRDCEVYNVYDVVEYRCLCTTSYTTSKSRGENHYY